MEELNDVHRLVRYSTTLLCFFININGLNYNFFKLQGNCMIVMIYFHLKLQMSFFLSLFFLGLFWKGTEGMLRGE